MSKVTPRKMNHLVTLVIFSLGYLKKVKIKQKQSKRNLVFLNSYFNRIDKTDSGIIFRNLIVHQY